MDLFLELQTRDSKVSATAEGTGTYDTNIKTYRTIPRRLKTYNIPTTAKPNTTLTNDFNGELNAYFLIEADTKTLDLTKLRKDNMAQRHT